MNGFDITQQPKTSDEESIVHIHGLDDKPLYFKDDEESDPQPVTITVLSVHSKKIRRFDESMRKRRIKASRLTGEALHEDSLDRAVHGTVTWQGFRSGEKALAPTAENVRMIYEQYPWVLDQVVEAMNDNQRFFSSASTPQ